MAIGNLDSLSASLAKMTPQQRQQYAAMHKNDPMIVALAKFINDAEQQKAQALRGAQMGQQGQPPKVVDQAIAGMAQQLPENTGIGALPAPNMQAMADGGIAGYAEGGEVERYQGGGRLPVTADTPYGIPGMTQPATSFVPQTGAPENQSPWLRRQFDSLVDSMEMRTAERRAEEARRRIARGVGTDEDYKRIQELEALKNPGPQTEVAASAPPKPAAPAAPAAPAPASAPVPAPPPAPAQRKPAAGPGGPAQSLEALYAQMSQRLAPDPNLDVLRSSITNAKKEDRTQTLADFDRDVAARTPFGAEREKRLVAREEKLAKDESSLGGLAMLEAGLAIMGGTSPYAMANIGAGATAGVKSYKQGKKDISDARDKLDDARSLIDEYRRNEDVLTKKERRGLERDIRSAQTEGLESLLAGAEKEYGYKREDLKAVINGVVQERVAHIKGGYDVQTAGMRAESGQPQKLAALAEKTLTNIRTAAQKAHPYNAAQRDAYVQAEVAKALQMNPDLAQYMTGATGGGGTPAAGTDYSKWKNLTVK